MLGAGEQPTPPPGGGPRPPAAEQARDLISSLITNPERRTAMQVEVASIVEKMMSAGRAGSRRSTRTRWRRRTPASRAAAGAVAAAAEQAAAFELAAEGGLGWRARTIDGEFSLAPELTPGMNRPGPPELWERFDAATAALAKALSGSSPATLAAAFTELSEVSGLLAADVQRTHRPAVRRGVGAMGTLVRLYLGWRLLRLLRPLLGAALVGGRAARRPRRPRGGTGTRRRARCRAGQLQSDMVCRVRSSTHLRPRRGNRSARRIRARGGQQTARTRIRTRSQVGAPGVDLGRARPRPRPSTTDGRLCSGWTGSSQACRGRLRSARAAGRRARRGGSARGRVGPEGGVDHRLAAAELGERVRADPELPHAPRGAAAGVLGAVTAGLVRRLPQRAGAHQLRQPVAALRRGLAVRDDAGEVVGQARQQARSVRISASRSATDWVITITWPPWLRPRCRIATARWPPS